ncbi:MAG: two-component regulator propeller domain-containing protein [Chloroflexota bacterium]|nr:two-component regulator propeller domain-containing protein [Chloroflexota bacterium]
MTTTIPRRCNPVPLVICMALLVLIACVPGEKSQKTVVPPLSAPCESGAWQFYGVVDSLVAIPVLSVAIDPAGSRWFGTGGGVSRMDVDGTWTAYTAENSALPPGPVVDIALDDWGNKWFGVGAIYTEGRWVGGGVGVLSADNVTWHAYTERDGLSPNLVTSIAVDAEGNAWVGTDGHGVSVLWADTGRWETFTVADGLASDSVWAVLVDPKGNKWFGTGYLGEPGGGVSKLSADGVTWTSYTAPKFYGLGEGLAANWVLDITSDAEGNTWFGTHNGGISVLSANGERWTTYNPENSGLAQPVVEAIAIDRQGNKWFATVGFRDGDPVPGGISVLRADGTWGIFTTDDGLASDWVKDIAIDEQGNVWFATVEGVSVWCRG